MPSVAVIIPVYNHARYLRSTLDSVLAQTRRAEHVIVIDDGSTDGSAEVVRRYVGRGVDFEEQANAGAHSTLNRLVAKAHAAGADYVAILNSDDRFLPGRLEACLGALEENPGCSVASTGLEVIGDDGAPLPEEHPRRKWFRAAWSAGERAGVTVPEWLGRANFIATTSNVVARTGYLLENPFRAYRFVHDYFFLGAAAVRGEIVLVPGPQLEYRVHGTNTITTDPAPLVREMLQLHLDLYAELAVEVSKDAEKRARFTEYTRALWENVSAFHAGLFQVAVARILADAGAGARAEAVAGLTGAELDTFPNRQLVNAYDGSAPLGEAGAGIAEKLDAALRDRAAAKEAAAANDRLARLRGRIGASRWVALGIVLGIARGLTKGDGKTPAEKLEKLRGAVAKSGWLKWGAKIGSKSARALLEP